MLELRRHVAESVVLGADVARRQHEAGNLSDLELASQEALVQEAKLDLADAELALADRREKLTALLGLWGGETRWRLPKQLPALPQEERAREGLESLAVERRLDLAAARQRVLAASNSPGLRRLWGFLPETAGATSEREAEGSWSVGPSLSLPIPAFDQRQADRAMAQARRRQSEADFAALAVQIRSDVRRSWARLEAARNRTLYYEQVALLLRAGIVEQTQRAYNGMLVGIYALLDAKREQIETGGAYVGALQEYWVARVALERALGTELPLADRASAPARSPEAPSAGRSGASHGHGSH
jgi:cobalt-zinc-cadmium efflux system outer membrane protein